jgi:hypothetical protein
VGAAVARLQLDRALVVPERAVELLQVAMRVPEVILQVRVVGVAHLGFLQPRDRLFPLLATMTFLAAA